MCQNRDSRVSPFDRLLPTLARLLVWGGVFAIIYILRSFSLLLFLTFVFSYILNRGVIRLAHVIPHRPTRTVLVTVIFLGILAGAVVVLAPKTKSQTVSFVTQLPQYLSRLDRELESLGARYPAIRDLVPELDPEAEQFSGTGARVSALLQHAFGSGPSDGQVKVNQMLDLVRGVWGEIAHFSSAFLLSLLFSFLIVLDLPQLTASAVSLQHSRLSFVYREVAGSLRDFANVLGRALEAQFVIAMFNSLLTAAGLLMLGLGSSLAFMTVIVFLCSFIPVLGVFISSVPICLIALQTSGLATMVLSIIMIFIVHLVEAYVLNPRVYGSYMHMNPVIVLVILTVGAKLFYVWGLLLGVPVCTYIFGQMIWEQKQEESPSLAPSEKEHD